MVSARQVAQAVLECLPGSDGVCQDWDGSWIVGGPCGALAVQDDGSDLVWEVYTGAADCRGRWRCEDRESSRVPRTCWDESMTKELAARARAALT